MPTPLVSENVQFIPVTEARLREHSPLSHYFEIYEPVPAEQSEEIYYRIRIIDLKTGSLVMNTEPMSAANWMSPGNAAIPIALRLVTEKLEKGSYRLEVQASDSAGRESDWRQSTFTIE